MGKSRKLSRKKSHKLRKSRKKSRKLRKFGYSHDMGPRMYGVHMSDGMLLANNAFSDIGNPLTRALNA